MQKLVAIVVAVAVIVVAFASVRSIWYHNAVTFTFPTLDRETRDETRYSLDGLYHVRGDESTFWSYEEGRNFWEPMEPIHTFMEKLQILMTAGAFFAGLWTLLVLLERRFLAVVSGVVSVSLFAVSPLIFFLGFGSAYSRTGLPGYQRDYTEFFLKTTGGGSSYDRSEIWGPSAGWWLAIAACATMAVGITVLAVVRRRESRTGRRTRPSLSPSGQP